ncbi:hypothetical protein [Olivibacter sp. XZL3]|uniref:hypothetical protein n=1 Tax=Olivibacter sp. XZL3 TaxID=1735116 RepID=UPI00106591C9|nr:hypothetical protein [Olivibacter sp. XZL3]
MIKPLRFKFKFLFQEKLISVIIAFWLLIVILALITSVREGLSLAAAAMLLGAVFNILFLLHTMRTRRKFHRSLQKVDGKYLPPPAKEGWED